jgi:adenylate kinase
MKLIFLGPPGAGKGTMAVRLADHLGIPHISTGDIFRYNIKNETDLGKQVKAILDSGELVPDELTIDLVKDRLQHDDTKKGFILDGFPRTIPQAEALSGFTDIDGAINFSLSDEEIVKRLSGRRVHPGSGRTYHVMFNPPKVEGKDDVTGEDLVIRPDDEVDAIRNRLEVYKRQTQPLIEFYEKRDLLTTIDASPKPDKVFEELTKVIEKLRS